MAVRIYLLGLEKRRDALWTERFIAAAERRVDATRLEKAAAVKKWEARAASLGAGLLLQKMVRDQQSGNAMSGMQCCTAEQLLEELAEPLPLQYLYGRCGKPRLMDFPLHFSLSHSGGYVLCAAADREIGADIQQFRTMNLLRLAKRFFPEQEYAALERCDDSEQERLFFTLWSRKEAYGKLTGQGVAAMLGRSDFSADWESVSAPWGYALEICTEIRAGEEAVARL